ncbi:MAG: glycosyltransferase family 39 protein [Chloroflexi bacterium]|nr:glycosyltransferase family 39 protein [Chloroflexota bacterium]
MRQVEQALQPTNRRILFIARYPRLRAYLPELLVLLIATIARFWRLNYHSIWFDEAVSLRWAGADPSFTWRKTFPLIEEKHPPVYYISLHFWQKLMGWVGLGHNDAALRAFGSLLGVLTVWGILLLARRLSGRPTALLAGLLVALSPILVWYSQELRMFQPATTGVVWASYCLLRAWQAERGLKRASWWLGFMATITLAFYSYLFSAFLLPAAGFTLLALLVSASKKTVITPSSAEGWSSPVRRFGEGVLAIGGTGLLFLPLVYNVVTVVNDEGAPGRAFANFGQTMARLLHIFTVWRVDWATAWVNAGLLLLGLLVLLGLLLPLDPGRKTPTPFPLDRSWLALWLGVPLLIGNLLLHFNDTVFVEDRYFIFIAPFALWALARGAIAVGQQSRIAGWLGGLAAVVLLGAALPQLWTPAMYRENWRAASHYVTDYQVASPGLTAAVVNHVDYTHIALEWYLRQTLSANQLPVYFPYGGTLTADQVDQVVAPPLEGIVKTGAATLWLVQSHLAGVDDQQLVEQWLNGHFALVTEQYPAGIKLMGYALQSHFRQLPALSPAAVKPMVTLVPGLTLAACELLTTHLAAHDEQLHPPSGWVHVRLWWQATGAIRDDYIATAQMVGPQGVWGDRLYRDNEALRRWPTHNWAAGEIVRDELDINLNPVTPDGLYPIMIGVMNGKGESVGNKVACGQVKIAN